METRATGANLSKSGSAARGLREPFLTPGHAAINVAPASEAKAVTAQPAKKSGSTSRSTFYVLGNMLREASAVVVGIAVNATLPRIPKIGASIVDALGQIPTATNQWVNASFGAPIAARTMAHSATVTNTLSQNSVTNFFANVTLAGACQWVASFPAEYANQFLLSHYDISDPDAKAFVANAQRTTLAYGIGKGLHSLAVAGLQATGLFSESTKHAALKDMKAATDHAVKVKAHEDEDGYSSASAAPGDQAHARMKRTFG